jgi:hypothetical protein
MEQHLSESYRGPEIPCEQGILNTFLSNLCRDFQHVMRQFPALAEQGIVDKKQGICAVAGTGEIPCGMRRPGHSAERHHVNSPDNQDNVTIIGQFDIMVNL